jgi:peptidoglycan biosynthesis protein MviN/MurJ (putative lipid II flippase)
MYAWLGVKGLAAGQAIAYTLGVPLQAWVLGRRAGGLDLREIAGSFARLAGATAGMAVVVWAALRVMDPLHDDGGLIEQSIAVTIPVVAGAAAYLAGAAALKAPELSFVRSVVKRRREGAISES